MRLSSIALLASLSLAACGGSAPSSPDGAAPTADAGGDAPPPPPGCGNRVQDGDETDVDCGGACGATCAAWARCDWHDDCANGGVCAEEPAAHWTEGIRTCRPVVAACAPGACGDGLCQTMETNLDPASPDAVTVAYCERRAELGAVCRQSGDKDARPCVDGAACAADPVDHFTDRCVPATTPAGAACQDQTCVAGYFCDHSSFGSGATCQPIRALGAACLNSIECATGLHCDAYRGVCEPRAPIGDRCFDGEAECVSGAHCAFAAGLACENWVQCGSQMDCCATPAGSECRVFDSHTHCEPPSGTCAAGAF